MSDCSAVAKLQYLLETKKLIAEALETQGETVYDTDTFRDYAAKILAIRKVSSVNGKQGDVILSANDVGAYSKEEVDTLIKEEYLTKTEYDNLQEKVATTKYNIIQEE